VVVGVVGGREAIREVALRHSLCPYYLTQELVRWSDVVIADYNYLFDTTASLHLLTVANEWKVSVLVDEAHNLVDRARSMYSATLSESSLREAKRNAPQRVAGQLDRLARAWRALSKTQSAPYTLHESLPSRWVSCLAEVCASITDCMAEAPEQIGAELLRFYFDALHFQRLSESFGGHSMLDATTEPTVGRSERTHTTLSIRNIVPASFLRPRWAASVTTVLFSATLTPHGFYADMLGLPSDTAWLDVASPFERSHLVVKVEGSISTRFTDRDQSLLPIAKLIESQFRAEPGNYLAFFSSFDYLDRAASTFMNLCPSIPVWTQARRQGDAERVAFLERFGVDSQGIGFAVLGGSFAEGVDLPGSRLIGAFIATLGLPQINPVNEQLRRAMEKMFGAGYEYAYLYPGLRKVVQAAGRVIRTVNDRGTIILIDDRFERLEVRALLPSWWKPETVRQKTYA
ncbi:MAG: ATP-dependent DNA helicase, partial [Pseudomonadota bacterium]|nr:ATP-dependent DNA helicase [Pseudomonadota bacterium]